MNQLYEILISKKLDLKNVAATVFNMDSTELLDTLIELNYCIFEENNDLTKKENSMFNFIANDSLSGGTSSCGEMSCRLNRINELCNFTALYSDKVLIKNPLETYFSFPQNLELNESTRESIVVDIVILWKLKPLIYSGIISFIQTEHHFCKECFRKLSSTEYFNYENRLNDAQEMLKKKILDLMEIYIVNEENDFYIEFNGPKELVEHGTSYLHFSYEIPPILKSYLPIVGRYKLKKEQYIEAGIFEKFNYEIVDDFAIQDWYTNNFDYSYLTNRDIDIELIKAINDQKENIINNRMMSGMTHIIPTFENLSLNKILKFRNLNIDLFEKYRINIHNLVKEVKPSNQNQYKEAFMDLVKPNIDNINSELKCYRKSMIKDIGLEILINSGLVIIGLHSGILPNNIGEIIATIGGVNGVGTAIKKGIDIGKIPSSIRNNPYFFLWKLQVKDKRGDFHNN